MVRGYLECGPVNGVRGELRQVFSNLITNAIEAVKQGGTIWLGAQSAGSGKEQSIEITIADDGGGIAAEHVDQIFEPFFTTKAGTGTGLGLWVAKEIIERHRGSISLHQTNGKDGQGGATFKIRLPGATVLRASNSAVKAASAAGKAQEEPSQSVEAGNF